MAKMVKVADLIAEMKKGMNDISIDFVTDYSGSDGYICDLFTEFADGQTSIYYSDIIRFISENVEAVNDAIAEFGWDGCGSDLYKAGQMAEFQQNEQLLYDDLTDICKLSALEMIAAVNDQISAEDWFSMEAELEYLDNNDYFSAVDDIVTAWRERLEEEEEEQETENAPDIISEVIKAVDGVTAPVSVNKEEVLA